MHRTRRVGGIDLKCVLALSILFFSFDSILTSYWSIFSFQFRVEIISQINDDIRLKKNNKYANKTFFSFLVSCWFASIVHMRWNLCVCVKQIQKSFTTNQIHLYVYVNVFTLFLLGTTIKKYTTTKWKITHNLFCPLFNDSTIIILTNSKSNTHV